MAVAGAAATPEEPDASGVDPGRMVSLGRRALVAELLSDGRSAVAGRRRELADRLATFTDARVERYWWLLGVLNGWAPFEPSLPAVEWWIAALRAAD